MVSCYFIQSAKLAISHGTWRRAYSFALSCAFSRIGPNFVAAIMLPLIFSLPCMNMF